MRIAALFGITNAAVKRSRSERDMDLHESFVRLVGKPGTALIRVANFAYREHQAADEIVRPADVRWPAGAIADIQVPDAPMPDTLPVALASARPIAHWCGADLAQADAVQLKVARDYRSALKRAATRQRRDAALRASLVAEAVTVLVADPLGVDGSLSIVFSRRPAWVTDRVVHAEIADALIDRLGEVEATHLDIRHPIQDVIDRRVLDSVTARLRSRMDQQERPPDVETIRAMIWEKLNPLRPLLRHAQIDVLRDLADEQDPAVGIRATSVSNLECWNVIARLAGDRSRFAALACLVEHAATAHSAPWGQVGHIQQHLAFAAQYTDTQPPLPVMEPYPTETDLLTAIRDLHERGDAAIELRWADLAGAGDNA